VRRLELAAIAIALGVIVAIVMPTCRAPRVAVSAPHVIDHPGEIEIDATLEGSVGRLELELDGEAVKTPPVIDRALPLDCDTACAITLRWNSDEAKVGRHDLSLVAFDDGDRRGAAHASIDVQDRVEAALARPGDLDLRGAKQTTVVLHARYRGAVRGEIALDGAAPIRASDDDCRDGCELSFPIDLASREGPHALAWSVTGDETTARGGARLLTGDAPYVSGIRVTGETDGPGTRLEIEAHLEDADTGAWIGCAGAAQGMEPVDFDDRGYTVRAYFVGKDGAVIGMDDLRGRRVRIHVIEDDSRPCPGPIALDDDDMGTSRAVAADQLRTIKGGFGEVVELQLQVGRPR